MTKSETHHENESKGVEYWLACERCSNETKHIVRQSIDTHDASPDGDIHVNNSFQIVECAGCRWLSFRHSWTSSEDVEYYDDGYGQAIDHVHVFPARLARSKPLEHDYYLPPGVKGIYVEAHLALRNAQPILAGIGIRALIEAVCAHKGANQPTLEKRIDGLVTLGVLTKEAAKILHGTRLLGNKAAHEVRPPTDDELMAAMQVAHNLLDSVYIIPKIAECLPTKQ